MSKRRSVLEIITKVHWSVGVATGLFLFVLVRFGIVWGFSKVLAGLAISPQGSMPPTVPQSFIDQMTWLAVIALLLCWSMALLSYYSRPKR